MKRWVFILTGVLFAVLALSTAAQDSTPQPGETPTLPFTETPAATETPLSSPTATFTPPPAPTETVEITPTFTLAPSETPFVEPTLTISETPATLPTLTAVPALPVTAWSVIYSDPFMTVDETVWQFTGAGWGFEPQSDGSGRLIVFNSTAPVFYRAALLNDAAIEASVDVAQGSASLYVRHSGAFAYEARLDTDGTLSLLRSDVILSSASIVDFSPALPHRVRLNSLGAQLWVEVDGVTQLSAVDPAPLPPGQVGFAASFPTAPGEMTPVPPQHVVGFDDVTIWQPAEHVTPTAQPSLTPTPYELGTLPPEPTEMPTIVSTPAPTSAAFLNSGNEGESESAAPALRSFSAMASDADYRLVPAGDVDGLYAAVNDANAGLITTIYLNADRPFNAVNRPDADYVLPNRINITGNVTIFANGAVLERDIYTDENGPYATERGPGRGRLFYTAPGATLWLHHVILRNTNVAPLPESFVGSGYGGALLNEGTLHLYDSLVFHNTAGPGGGGLMNFIGTAHLYRVRFEDNFAGGGGAIQNDGDGQLFVECSQFVSNGAGYGGAVLNGGAFLDDGTILNDDSSMTIRYSAFTGNQSISERGRDVFNLLPDFVIVDLAQNWWGPDGILPGDLSDDVEPNPVSFITEPLLTSDPTVPDAAGNYGYAPCRPVIPQAELTLQLRLDDPSLDPNDLIVGQMIPVSAIVTNTGNAPTRDPVTLTLRVPNGLAPLEVSTRGDTLNVFEILLNLLFEIITRIVGGSTLAIGRQETLVSFSYDVGVLAPGETRAVELELMVRPTFAGTFVIEGNTTTDVSMAAGMFGTAAFDAPQSSPVLSIDTSLELQVTNPAALQLEMSVVTGSARQPDDVIVYSVKITNPADGSAGELENVQLSTALLLVSNGVNRGSSQTVLENYAVVSDQSDVEIETDTANGTAQIIVPLFPVNSFRTLTIAVGLTDYSYAEDGILLNEVAIVPSDESAEPLVTAQTMLPNGVEVALFPGFQVDLRVTNIATAFLGTENDVLNLTTLGTIEATGIMPRQASFILSGWIFVPEREGGIELTVLEAFSPYNGLRVWVGEQIVYSRWAGENVVRTALPVAAGLQPFYAEFYFYVAPENLGSQNFTAPILSWTDGTTEFATALVPRPVASLSRANPVFADSTSIADAQQPSAYFGTCPGGRIQLVPVFTGQGQETFDMQAVAEHRADGSTPSGLVIHDGPTWNAVQFGVIPWGTVVPVDRRIVFEQTGDIADQVWYRLAPGSPYFDPTNDRWIAVRMPGTLRTAGSTAINPFVYAVGLGEQDGALNTFCASVPDIEPTATVSFTYDRQAAAEYGMAHAYRNSIPGQPTLYPGWVQPNAQRRVTRYIGDENLGASYVPYQFQIRFAPFWYSGVTGVAGSTGSAVFNSELFWMGGLPMTGPPVEPPPSPNAEDVLIQYCNQPTPVGLDTWRYCPELSGDSGLIGASSPPWDYHPDLLTYFSNGQTGPNNQPLLDQRGVMIAVFDMYTTDDLSTSYTNFSESPLCRFVGVAEPCDRREISFNNSGFENLDADATAERFYQLLISTEFLDADAQTREAVISPAGTQITIGSSERGIRTDLIASGVQRLDGDITQVRTGDYVTVPDDPPETLDDHGFFVAGWGPIRSCPTALSTDWSLASNPIADSQPLYPDHGSALQGYITRPYIVPYVVDFPGGVDRTQQNVAAGALSDQLQRPKPRPFYCSSYDDPATNPIPPNATEPVESFFNPTHDTGYWRFYTLSSELITIAAERLYFPSDEWYWNARRCASLTDCGG